MKMEVQLLGTGGSFGIPGIGCHCSVCRSKNPKNQRLRSSCLVKCDGMLTLIDPSPDIRQVCLRYGIEHIDRVLVTHYHEDHIGGFNDLRPLFIKNHGSQLPLYLSEESLSVVQMRFAYLMHRFEIHKLQGSEGKSDGFSYFSYRQGDVGVTGFRFGCFAYVTDIKEHRDEIFGELEGVEALVIGALNWKGTGLHFSLEEAMEFCQQVGAKQVIFTHISHEIEHEETNRKLPKGFTLGYDGMVIECQK